MPRRKESRIGKQTLKLILRELEYGAASLGWDVRVWARKSGVSCSTIYRLKTGRTRFPYLDTVVLLANAVHCDLVTAEAGSVVLRLKADPKVQAVFTEQGVRKVQTAEPQTV